MRGLSSAHFMSNPQSPVGRLKSWICIVRSHLACYPKSSSWHIILSFSVDIILSCFIEPVSLKRNWYCNILCFILMIKVQLSAFGLGINIRICKINKEIQRLEQNNAVLCAGFYRYVIIYCRKDT